MNRNFIEKLWGGVTIPGRGNRMEKGVEAWNVIVCLGELRSSRCYGSIKNSAEIEDMVVEDGRW